MSSRKLTHHSKNISSYHYIGALAHSSRITKTSMLQVDQLQGGGEDSFTANVSKQLSE